MDVIDGIDLHGKNAVVTGGYSGLGLETVRALSSAGATVFEKRDYDRYAAYGQSKTANILFAVELDICTGHINCIDCSSWNGTAVYRT